MTRIARLREHPSYQALMALVKVSGLLLKAGDRFFKRHGLTQVQFNVLMILRYVAPAGCRQSDICRHLLVRAANMSSLVRRMAARGLVMREDDPTDQRAWRVRCSAKGREWLDRVEPEYCRIIGEIVAGHAGSDSRRFVAWLDRTQQAIERHAS